MNWKPRLEHKYAELNDCTEVFSNGMYTLYGCMFLCCTGADVISKDALLRMLFSWRGRGRTRRRKVTLRKWNEKAKVSSICTVSQKGYSSFRPFRLRASLSYKYTVHRDCGFDNSVLSRYSRAGNSFVDKEQPPTEHEKYIFLNKFEW